MNNEQLNNNQVSNQPNVQPVPNPSVGQPTEPVAPVASAPTEPVVPAVPTSVASAPTEPVAPAVPTPVASAPTEPVAPAVPTPVASAPTEPVAPAVPTPVASAPTEPVVPAVPTPVVSAPTEPVVPATPSQSNEPKQEEVQTSVIEVEEPKEDISDVANTTFDYNELYGVEKTDGEIKQEEELDVVEKRMFTEQEIVIDAPTVGARAAEDIVPEFNANALDEHASNTNKVSDSAMNDDEKDKAETRRALLWIIVLILILVVFVGFIFPIITGVK